MPVAPFAGVARVGAVGANSCVTVFLKIETELLPSFETTKSGLPSPSMSPRATSFGDVPAAKSTLDANEPAVMLPIVLVFRNIETVLLTLLVTAISGLPSPSTSPSATERAFVPVVKSTLAAKDPVVILPLVLVFRNMEIELPVQLVTTMSGLPSPSTSPSAIRCAYVPTVKSTLVANDPVVILPGVLMLR